VKEERDERIYLGHIRDAINDIKAYASIAGMRNRLTHGYKPSHNCHGRPTTETQRTHLR
jgi:uncharacterized protein with HEPN domain